MIYKLNNQKINLISLLIFLLIISCRNKTENKIESWNKATENHKNRNIIKVDTLNKLLEIAKTKDTLEYSNQDPFWFFKSGKLFSKKVKNLILINCPTDTTYKIELYSLINKIWKKTDELNNLKVPNRQYEIIFADYNFDSFNDIYLNSTSSNGVSMSKGYLLIVNSLTQKFEIHLEANSLNNILPDKKTKSILVDSLEYTPNGKIIWNLIYKWKNGKLVNTNHKIKTKQVY